MIWIDTKEHVVTLPISPNGSGDKGVPESRMFKIYQVGSLQYKEPAVLTWYLC